MLEHGIDIGRTKLTRRSYELGAYSISGGHSDVVFLGEGDGADSFGAGFSLVVVDGAGFVSLFESALVLESGLVLEAADAAAAVSDFVFALVAASRSAFLPSLP